MGYDLAVAVARESWWEKLPYQCKNVKKYNGLKKPKCNNGKGCKLCYTIYYAKNNEYGIFPTILFS